MRYLGIDYGTKRIGLALSDDEGRIAFPAGVILNTGEPEVLKDLRDLIGKERVGKIIVGLPKQPGRPDSVVAEEIKIFAQALSKVVSCSVKLNNELLTTKIAEEYARDKKNADASAAALILQGYLDMEMNK